MNEIFFRMSEEYQNLKKNEWWISKWMENEKMLKNQWGILKWIQIFAMNIKYFVSHITSVFSFITTEISLH